MEKKLADMCRTCLSTEKKMEGLFSLTLTENAINAVEFIRKITDLKVTVMNLSMKITKINFQVEQSDTVPDKICTDCILQISNAYNFVQQCIKSEELLRKQETIRIFWEIEKEALSDDIPNDDLHEIDNIIENEPSIENVSVEKIQTSNKYTCSTCSQTFTNKVKFQKHEKIHDNTNPFKCEQCEQTFSKKFYLSVHMRSHKADDEKKFVCSTCGKQYIFEYLLKRHEFKHKQDKPYPCAVCGKGCLTSQSYNRHMITHDKNYSKKKYTCKNCGKDFSYPSYLAEHIKSHTGEKPYLCSICGKTFRQAGALHYHQRIHTDYKPYTCKLCNEKFRSQSIIKSITVFDRFYALVLFQVY